MLLRYSLDESRAGGLWGEDADRPTAAGALRSAAMRRTVWRWIRRLALAVVGLLALGLASFVVSGWPAFAQRATGERRARMERSRQWIGGGFENPQPLWNDVWGSM